MTLILVLFSNLHPPCSADSSFSSQELREHSVAETIYSREGGFCFLLSRRIARGAKSS